MLGLEHVSLGLNRLRCVLARRFARCDAEGDAEASAEQRNAAGARQGATQTGRVLLRLGFVARLARSAATRCAPLLPAPQNASGADVSILEKHALRRKRESGFSLIEVLVALAITASVFLVASRLYGSALGATTRSEQMTQAALAAESKLAEFGVVEPLRAGRTEGRSGDFRWTADIRDYAGVSAEMQDRLPVRAYEVAVTVVWGAAENAQVTIRTVKLGPRPRRE